jgi:hypothetical protein
MLAVQAECALRTPAAADRVSRAIANIGLLVSWSPGLLLSDRSAGQHPWVLTNLRQLQARFPGHRQSQHW